MLVHQFSFEKLEVWQLARKLAGMIYRVTKVFPPEEKFSLTSQVRRAALSVCSNLAEGSTRTSVRDQAHFTTMAFGSLMEVCNYLIIAFDLGYIDESILNSLKKDIKDLAIKLSNLKAYQLRKA